LIHAPALESILEGRRQRLRQIAAERGLEAVVMTSDASIAYLTGFSGLQFERLFAVVVMTVGSDVIIAPKLEEQAVSAAPTTIDRITYGPESNGLAELGATLGNARRLGVEEDHLNFSRANALSSAGFHLVGAGSLVMELRAQKDEHEVERIRQACYVVEQALERAFGELRIGDVEQDVNRRVEHWLRDQGATDVHALILFGPNSANPHGHVGAGSLAAGDVICADLSTCIEGYWGDLTRCGTAGPPSAWALETWGAVLKAQAAAIGATKVGVPANAIDAAQRQILETVPQLGRCLHGAGHAIGRDIHEPPYLVPRTETPVAAGMVFTIEPGLYHSGVGGIRLEDDVLVTEGGPVTLSTLPLGLRVVHS
jgi:Xaa-Pro dipeptidase